MKERVFCENEKTVTIKKYNMSGTFLYAGSTEDIVPSEVTRIEVAANVTEIRDWAFDGWGSLEVVTLPEAFDDCHSGAF